VADNSNSVYPKPYAFAAGKRPHLEVACIRYHRPTRMGPLLE
jgi:hypothetical protein